MNEESPVKEVWGNVKYLFTIVAMGLWYGLLGVVALAMFLQLILKIDITELDRFLYLLLLSWGVGTVGMHLYFKNKEENLIQEQLGKLSRKETVYNAHPKLIERYKKEEEFKKFIEKRRELGTESQNNEEEFEVQVRLPPETYEPQPKEPRKLAFMISAEHTAEEALEAFHKFQQTGKPVISLKKNNQPSQNDEKN
ncbi:hypothetical protein A2W67_01915 [Candidatus Nomurabacteria bacterium RIFCSPLOWO2_02_40_28]|uniref:Uncharacterized protein n=2 Tax=Candidatus Nomuraibacteriota TaxID=1752729 RepID=A0A837HVM7_9BACT|nr:MAG: hypothetical protein UT27_C0005G0035 [Candidatus Nomurabacteria bacterium GW2011_GWD2_39_12]KKR20301.1 MAG: hypothetical protein UT51_C0005G0034 [Candidatus Nomurabacteria bacterium GW2011_GWC2_39_41]KKR36547.1 MAG: hypothetical protein UT70_C0010G0034 [Candidatus Nomurabacteria bacterium GW2011_GWE2_40_10]KKR38394.1 MAG: hypothetical protein UT73_C0003G0034 [Candidatus Nomurabacteria bacterium GW2011_GWB1_40_11]KKR39893.1 MAG: hypothetical protein UT74_C0005G0110 [Parcubacteria group b